MKILISLSMISGLVLFAGCNTMEGFGKDLQQVGDEIEEEAS